MSFLDNSGNIVIDCVLTDAGRKKLAEGNFKPVKFALSDDEINYANYNSSHASGSAYYDLEILQTPIFEAFTNNTSVMKSKLLTINRNNLLYLPVMKINTVAQPFNSVGSYVVAVDNSTETSFSNVAGTIMGYSLGGSRYARVDQGLDTSEIPPSFTIDSDLVESQYIVEIDNRFGKIVSKNGIVANVSYIDDDDIASYFLTLGTDTTFVEENTSTSTSGAEVIAGPRGTILSFQIQSSIELMQSTYLFEKLGSTTTMTGNSGTVSVYYIDAYINVMGATTGTSVQIPIRFIKNV